MEVTGKGETRGMEAAPSAPKRMAPRQDWAANASNRAGHVAEGHYMGETKLTRNIFDNNELKINPDQFYRAEGYNDGGMRHGKYPV